MLPPCQYTYLSFNKRHDLVCHVAELIVLILAHLTGAYKVLYHLLRIAAKVLSELIKRIKKIHLFLTHKKIKRRYFYMLQNTLIHECGISFFWLR
jgi:hypothetical protein